MLSQSTLEDDPPRVKGQPRVLDSAGQSQQGAIFSFVQPPSMSEVDMEPEL